MQKRISEEIREESATPLKLNEAAAAAVLSKNNYSIGSKCSIDSASF